MSTPLLYNPHCSSKATLDQYLAPSNRKAVETLAEQLLSSTRNVGTDYYIVSGQRGIGKTHILMSVYYRLMSLHPDLLTVFVNLENGERTFTDFLNEVLGSLAEKDHDLKKLLYSFTFENQKYARVILESILLRYLKGRKLLVIAESLDKFLERTKRPEQRLMQAFMEETKQFILAGTSLDRLNTPIFGSAIYCQVSALPFDECLELANISQTDSANIQKLQPLYCLLGGVPRIWLMIRRLLEANSEMDGKDIILGIVDFTKAYYSLNLVGQLSIGKQKVLMALAEAGNCSSVGQIARLSRMTPQTASGQLMRLKKQGIVCFEKKSRESYYKITDPLLYIYLLADPDKAGKIRCLLSEA